ncbi:hypothetical protein [Bathymodiolus japonicus methanotrophic gill symbiont]|uniref:hypothetical protein n=1 Tax=Bathymodiolus japonicus methanotrophic gill symbiont TaxID=113269 RepID=UPI001C8DFBCC|nr:hypothetical protein [Bathymodiolus japonicus methanotrophic gill symbiont]
MPAYRVLEDGFHDGVYRTPGGEHDPVITKKKLMPCPDWLEYVVNVTDAQKLIDDDSKKNRQEKQSASALKRMKDSIGEGIKTL